MPKGNEVYKAQQEHVRQVIEQAESQGYDLDMFVAAAEKSEGRIKNLVKTITDLTKSIPDADKNGMTLAIPQNPAELLVWVKEYKTQSRTVGSRERFSKRRELLERKRSVGRPSSVSSRYDRESGKMVYEKMETNTIDGNLVWVPITEEEYKSIHEEEKALNARDKALAKYRLTPDQRQKVDENFRVRKEEKSVRTSDGREVPLKATVYESKLFGFEGQWQDMGGKDLYETRLGEYVAKLKATPVTPNVQPQNLAQRISNIFGG